MGVLAEICFWLESWLANMRDRVSSPKQLFGVCVLHRHQKGYSHMLGVSDGLSLLRESPCESGS